MLLPTITAAKDDQGRATYAVNYTGVLDPLVRALATERAENEEIDVDLDCIADLAARVEHATDEDAADDPAGELSWRIDQLLDLLGEGAYILPVKPNTFDLQQARKDAFELRSMADKLSAWADMHAAGLAA
ncbi:hypothetical protein [Kitasatospora cheerisanensis]|uniref:Uncharacterized protein n=1 Tax=Kitasatospora cheerisanensis KCTC 2395 TaxID=1348663 RepID=A0A066Z6F3_9ACTN|nr:hypothetical protein [Kitasatospora cheerisanensis]KDN85720.1 hypothetical protein KCH_25480 [Kitasatospora cheerisanensis KCTC 2395]